MRLSKRLGEALEHLKQRNAVKWPIKSGIDFSFFAVLGDKVKNIILWQGGIGHSLRSLLHPIVSF
ncbi:MAG: hypothetical protein PF692_07705 [Kiritimatiellae bacterium]|jgi:hypothetical protein|nr:hypothetical protein [Kiritimatiellia bacterium]